MRSLSITRFMGLQTARHNLPYCKTAVFWRVEAAYQSVGKVIPRLAGVLEMVKV